MDPEHLENAKIRVVSFDIFDTVVTRVTAEPKGIFHKVARALEEMASDFPSSLLKDFTSARRSAEKIARQRSERDDINIHDIYAVLAEIFELSQRQVETLIALEVETELASIKPVHTAKSFIELVRAKKRRVIFVSDMYLPLEVVEQVLVQCGVFCPGDGLYVSGCHGLSKKSGSLFRKVLTAECCNKTELVHYGDSLRGDLMMARMVGGVTSFLFTKVQLNSYEKILLNPDTGRNALGWQILAGASRLARLEAAQVEDPRHRALYEVGANVAGPVFFGFIHWVLRRAVKDGVRRLYFMARDGEVMFEVARKIAEQLELDIELRYLYVSRQALFAASFNKLSDEEIRWVTLRDPYLTLRLVAKRLWLNAEVFHERIMESGCLSVANDDKLSVPQVDRLRSYLRSDQDFRAYFFRNAKVLAADALGYFRQEGLLDDVSWAVVDSGWNGRLQHAIQKILERDGWALETIGYYFGLFDKYCLKGQKSGFLFSSEAPEYISWCRPFTFVFEVMTTATHGMTTRYSKTATGSYAPVLDDRVDPEVTEDVTALRAGVKKFLEFLLAEDYRFDDVEFRKASFLLLKRFYLKPSGSQASALGQMPFAHDQAGDVVFPLAPPLGLKQVMVYLKNLLTLDKYAQTFWVNGSRVQSPFMSKGLLWVIGWLYVFLNAVYVRILRSR